MTPGRLQKIKQVLDRRQPDLTVVADEVHKGRNIAAVLRTCDAVGIDTVYCVSPKAGFRPYRGTALGTQKWVEVKLVDCVSEPLTELARGGFQLIVAAIGADAVDFREVDYTLPTALVLGSERDGLSHLAVGTAHKKVTIPMMGMVQSYNVSVACAIVLAEAQRQRALAGMYAQRRLSDDGYRRRFFQWAHPEVASYCDRKGLSYPAVGENGEIVAPANWHAAVKLGS